MARTCFFISLFRAEPAFWYSIWLVNCPKLMVPVESRRSVPMMAGPVCTRIATGFGRPSTATS